MSAINQRDADGSETYMAIRTDDAAAGLALIGCSRQAFSPAISFYIESLRPQVLPSDSIERQTRGPPVCKSVRMRERIILISGAYHWKQAGVVSE